ncbi:MAG: 2-C-methyl-D-erythritol 4-phosphate cytidylyltransferase [Casimicrobiaceae bacterium]
MRYHALIPAAGAGARFGAELPKQYATLSGKPVLLRAMERLAAHLPLHRTYIALAAGDTWFERLIGPREGVTVLRCGGATRAATVRNALQEMRDAADDDWIVVHDAVRPCVDAASLARLQQELAGDETGGVLAMPVTASLKRAGGDMRVLATEPRENLWQAQTPQMFRYGVLCAAFARPGIEQMTDEAQVVEAFGRRPKLIVGNPGNLKVTYPDDLRLATAILAAEESLATERSGLPPA